jgi:uncharacterized protein (TIGR03435 family)
MPLRDVIRVAYGLQSFQMNEWPDWLSRSYFDIQAKTSGNPNQDQRLTMLRQLLATRFKLTAHWQTGQGPSYELMPARDDRALGNKIVRSKADCAALRARLAVNPAPPSPNAPLAVCGIRNLPGRIVALGVSSDILAKTLTDVVRRPVTDGTELSGTFDFEIEYTPDPMPLPSELPPDSRPIDPSGPSIFTAIREQLGLKLADRQQPIQILVIDHVEAPSLN